jgi:hypothetical protein
VLNYKKEVVMSRGMVNEVTSSPEENEKLGTLQRGLSKLHLPAGLIRRIPGF